MIEYKGKFQGEGISIGIVCARFNEAITKNLLSGALDALYRQGVEENHIAIAWVPGAFEIPLIAKTMAQSRKYDAIICLGAVIRGATPHFDLVAGQTAAGITHASLETDIPIIFGVLTTDTIEQAIERSGTKAGNKGFDCALSAVEMANLQKQLQPTHVTSPAFRPKAVMT